MLKELLETISTNFITNFTPIDPSELNSHLAELDTYFARAKLIVDCKRETYSAEKAMKIDDNINGLYEMARQNIRKRVVHEQVESFHSSLFVKKNQSINLKQQLKIAETYFQNNDISKAIAVYEPIYNRFSPKEYEIQDYVLALRRLGYLYYKKYDFDADYRAMAYAVFQKAKSYSHMNHEIYTHYLCYLFHCCQQDSNPHQLRTLGQAIIKLDFSVKEFEVSFTKLETEFLPPIYRTIYQSDSITANGLNLNFYLAIKVNLTLGFFEEAAELLTQLKSRTTPPLKPIMDELNQHFTSYAKDKVLKKIIMKYIKTPIEITDSIHYQQLFEELEAAYLEVMNLLNNIKSDRVEDIFERVRGKIKDTINKKTSDDRGRLFFDDHLQSLFRKKLRNEYMFCYISGKIWSQLGDQYLIDRLALDLSIMGIRINRESLDSQSAIKPNSDMIDEINRAKYVLLVTNLKESTQSERIKLKSFEQELLDRRKLRPTNDPFLNITFIRNDKEASQLNLIEQKDNIIIDFRKGFYKTSLYNLLSKLLYRSLEHLDPVSDTPDDLNEIIDYLENGKDKVSFEWRTIIHKYFPTEFKQEALALLSLVRHPQSPMATQPLELVYEVLRQRGLHFFFNPKDNITQGRTPACLC